MRLELQQGANLVGGELIGHPRILRSFTRKLVSRTVTDVVALGPPPRRPLLLRHSRARGCAGRPHRPAPRHFVLKAHHVAVDANKGRRAIGQLDRLHLNHAEAATPKPRHRSSI
jgi:hypothetical protein